MATRKIDMFDKETGAYVGTTTRFATLKAAVAYALGQGRRVTARFQGPTRREAKIVKSLHGLRNRVAAQPAITERWSTRNGRAKYGFYVVDKLTGLVHAGNEFREDAVDERKAMIEEGVPASRVAVMTAASVRSKFGAIRWGTGRP